MVIGGKAIEGVLAAHVDCFKLRSVQSIHELGLFSFSAQNNLQVPVANVRAISSYGGKIVVQLILREAFSIRGPIRPGLAVRFEKYVVETNVRQITARLRQEFWISVFLE